MSAGKKIKVLIIPTLGLAYEGITSVIYNYISHMDCEGLDLNFISFLDMDIDLQKKFECFGQVVLLPKRKQYVLKYICLLFKLFKKNKYDVIHVHGNSGTMLIEVLLAKLTRVKKIIVHGHSTECNHEIINKILKFIMLVLSDERLACSDEAGKFLYSKRNFVVLNNAIDLQKYQYDEQVRFKCREEFCVKDEILIGHIGNFYSWKNHAFLIDVFRAYHKINKNSKLLLVSDGPLCQEMQQKVKDLGLEKDVIFAGRRADVERLYQAMDIFIFPSLYEGLGLVAVEAQTAGLPVLASTNVPIEAGCTDLFERMELEKGAKAWAEKIENIISKENDRNKNRKEQIRACGFDIENECEKLRKIYLEG